MFGLFLDLYILNNSNILLKSVNKISQMSIFLHLTSYFISFMTGPDTMFH